MDNIQEELTKGWEEIVNHQKIKMADKYEYSWGMMEAYEYDELADDSADEKQMEKAKRRAEKSATKRSRVPSSSKQEGPEQKRHSRNARWSQLDFHLNLLRGKWLQGPCWSCGRVGHSAATCSQVSKWYPFLTPAWGCDW